MPSIRARESTPTLRGNRTLVASLPALLGPQGAQLAELFDCLEEVQVWIKDRQGRYVWVNRSFLKNYVINEEAPLAGVNEIRGRTDYDLCPPDLADQYHSDDAQVLAGNPVVNRIELVGRRDGLASWHMTNKIPLRTKSGRVVGSAGLTWELKERDAILAPAGELGPVLSYIRDHYNKPISNTQFARLAGLSVRAFERKFRLLFQVAPQEYLRKLRLRMASRALLFTRQSIVEVALNCGFGDQSHFTREFHRHFGRTPRDYRDQHGRPAAASITKSAVRKQ